MVSNLHASREIVFTDAFWDADGRALEAGALGLIGDCVSPPWINPPREPADAKIVAALAHLACDLGFAVVAEGIETREQLDFVKSCGCDEAQGFHLHRPLPAEELSALLQQVPLLLTQAA